MSKIKNFISTAKNFEEKNKPAICMGTAIAGVILTGITAYQAGQKIQEILLSHEEDFETAKTHEEKKKVVFSVVKEAVPAVLPPIIIGGASIAAIVTGNKESNKRIATLAAAYSVSERGMKELNDKMTDMLGEKKVRSIKEEIAKDHVKKDRTPAENQIILTGDGDVLCKDVYSGRYFRSNAQKIGAAINEVNAECASSMYVSLNELYEKLNLPQIPLGEDLGWNCEDLFRGQLPITFTAVLTEDNQPCLALEYNTNLRTDYRDLH